MNLFRKVAASITLAALVISTGATGVSAYSSAELTAANGLAAANVINDHAANPADYNLASTILRSEAAKVAVNLDDSISMKTTCDNSFADVSATTPNTWVCGYAEALLDAGKLSANTNFNPLSNLTKSEATKMMLEAAGCTDVYTNAAAWQAETVAFAADNNIIDSYTDYNTPATRGFVFQVAYNAMNTCPIEEVACDSVMEALGICTVDGNTDNGNTDNGNTDNGNTDNGNTDTSSVANSVSLASNTPVDGNIPANAANIEFMKFNITAGDTDLTVNSVTLTRKNLGDRSDFKKVWLSRDGVVATNDKTITSDDTVNLTLNVVIPAGETYTYTVNASMNGHTNKVNNFEVTSVDASETVSGTPLEGAALTTVNYDVAALTFTVKGSDTNVDMGDEQKVVGEFKLEETGSNKKDVNLKSIRFKNTGTADLENFANFGLFVDGVKVSTAAIIDGKYITFKTNNLVIEDAKSKLFTIKADAIDGTDGEYLTLELKDTFDIYALEETTNIGAGIVASTPVTLKNYTLNAGKVKISEDTTNPSSDYVIKDTDDQLVFVAKADLGQDVTVDSLRLLAEAKSGSTNVTEADLNKYIENVKLVIGDTVVDTVDTITTGADTASVLFADKDYYNFDSSFTLHDNDLIKVYVKVTKDAVPNFKLKVKLDNTSNANGSSVSLKEVEYVSSGDAVKSNDFGGTASSKGLTVKSATTGVSIVRNDGNSAGEVYLAGQNNAELLGFIVNAGTESDLKINKLEFDFGYGSAALSANETTNYTNCKLVTNNGDLGSTEDLNSSSTLVIDDINTTIPAGAQQEFALSCNIDLSASEITPKVTLNLADSSSSVIYDVNDNEITGLSSISSPDLAIKSNAELAVSVDGNTPTEAIVIAEASNLEVAKYKFEATDGNVKVKEVLLNDNSNKQSTTRVRQYTLYADGQELMSRTPSNGVVHFDMGDAGFVVAKDAKVVLTVKADFNDITDADQTNERIKVQLADIVAETQATGNDLTKVNGSTVIDSDGTDSDLASSNIDGDLMYIRDTQVTLATKDLGETVLNAGTNKSIYKVGITADAHNDADVASIKFNVSASNVDVANYKLYVDGVDKTADGSFAGTVFTFNSGKDQTVSAGTEKVFELRADISNVDTTNGQTASLSVNVQEDANTSAGAESAVSGNLIWSDTSGSPHSRTTTDWFNAYKVNGLDTASSTLTK